MYGDVSRCEGVCQNRGDSCTSLWEGWQLCAGDPGPGRFLEPRASYNQLDVVKEEDEQCGSSLSLFIFAVLGIMTSRDGLDEQDNFPGVFCF